MLVAILATILVAILDSITKCTSYKMGELKHLKYIWKWKDSNIFVLFLVRMIKVKTPLISYLEPISGPLKFRSTEMQYVMYQPTLFYYSFSQYTTYVNILKINEIQIFSFYIATKYAKFLGLHLLAQCSYFAMTGWYWNVSYTPWILNLYTEYGKWPISTKLVLCTFIFNTVQQHTYHTDTIATTKYWVLRK